MRVIVRRAGFGLILFSIFSILIALFIFWFFRIYELDFHCIKEMLNDIPMFLTLILLLGLCIFLIDFGVRNLYKELKKPRKIISYNKRTDELYLHPDEITLHIRNITETKYIHDIAPKGLSRERLSGTLTICTDIKNYEYSDVSLVQVAADILENIVYDYYHKDSENNK